MMKKLAENAAFSAIKKAGPGLAAQWVQIVLQRKGY
jgi:hypothetical protein